MSHLHLVIYLLLMMFLTACSSEQKNDVSPATIASVNAGQDMTIVEGVAFTINAQVYPEGGELTWVQTQGPAVAEFPEDPTVTLDLIAPDVTTDSLLTFEITYTSLDGQQVTDAVDVYVTNQNKPPVAIITATNDDLPPYNTYDLVTLTGEDSYDTDGEIRQYIWRQIDSNAPLSFTSDLVSQDVTFEAPLVAELTNYKLQLTVVDNFEASQSNIYDVQVSAAGVSIAANAGEDQTVDEFTLVILDGSNSVATNTIAACLWQQSSGTSVTINDSDTCTANFVAPDVDSEETLIFELVVTDPLNNTASDSVSITVGPLNFGSLHDTGVTECYDNTDIIDCGADEFPAQDADHGRDSVYEVLDKSGQGNQGFDFTKFDSNGDEIPNDSEAFSCVRDNFTGLIWEVKSATGVPAYSTLRGAENYYSYDDSAAALSSCSNGTACNVDGFVSAVNSQSFCGGANWRIPTYMELLSIMNYNDLDDDFLLDQAFFPNSPNKAALGHLFYWTSDVAAEGGGGFQWVLDLSTGDDSAILPSKVGYIMLVRTP